MPLVLDDPETVTIQTVRITSFNCIVEPLICQVNYVTGTTDAQGVFTQIGGGTATFDQAQIAVVDPTGSIYNSMKDALYELLESVVGPGTID